MGKNKIKIPEEIMKKVTMLNCNDEDSIRRLKKSLMKLPFINSKEDLQTDNLEKLVDKIENKHNLSLSYFMKYKAEGIKSYSCMVKNDEGEWLKTVHSITIWEGLAKALFFMYYHIESKKENK